jgi:hypothetical protein
LQHEDYRGGFFNLESVNIDQNTTYYTPYSNFGNPFNRIIYDMIVSFNNDFLLVSIYSQEIFFVPTSFMNTKSDIGNIYD